MSGSMSGVWKRSHGSAGEAPPGESGGKQIGRSYSHRVTPRLYQAMKFADLPECLVLLARADIRFC
jgi:hypothetical protein